MSTRRNDKSKLTPTQREAKELRRQIDRRLKDIEKRGYIATDKLKTNLSKHISRAKLREIKENIYKYVKYYDPLKDMYVSGAERRKQEQDEPVIISIDYYVKLKIHNETSKERPDYENVVVVGKDGNKYYTGSSSFMTNLEEIYDEMTDAGETEITIEVYRKPSKNYNGKEFITCSVV